MEVTKELEKKIEKEILEHAAEGRIPCALARQIAQKNGVSARYVGKKLNEMKIKIYACELGCF